MTKTTQTEAFRIADLPEDDAQAMMADIYYHAARNIEHYRSEAIGDIGIWDTIDRIEDVVSLIRNMDLTGANVPDRIARAFSQIIRLAKRGKAAAEQLKDSM